MMFIFIKNHYEMTADKEYFFEWNDGTNEKSINNHITWELSIFLTSFLWRHFIFLFPILRFLHSSGVSLGLIFNRGWSVYYCWMRMLIWCCFQSIWHLHRSTTIFHCWWQYFDLICIGWCWHNSPFLGFRLLTDFVELL